MGWTQKIDYEEVKVTLPPPVKKQVWDGEKFVPMTLYRHNGVLSQVQQDWLRDSFAPRGTYLAGQYWNYSAGGGYTVMDEKVYTWYQIKWGNK